MPSFQITIKPNDRAAGRFVHKVRRALQKAYAEEKVKRGLTQTAIAQAIGVHRSVINRELRGQKDITLGRVAELAWALGRSPLIEFPERVARPGSNIAPQEIPVAASGTNNPIDFDPSHVDDSSSVEITMPEPLAA